MCKYKIHFADYESIGGVISKIVNEIYGYLIDEEEECYPIILIKRYIDSPGSTSCVTVEVSKEC